MVFEEIGTWEDSCQQTLIPDNNTARLSPIPEDESETWRKDAQLVAIGGYRMILEDGPELSESSDGSGDEVRTGMYAIRFD
jgi:hypothetical protein